MNDQTQTTRRWWEPAPRARPLFDFYDMGGFIALGIQIGIGFCVAVNHGWPG